MPSMRLSSLVEGTRARIRLSAGQMAKFGGETPEELIEWNIWNIANFELGTVTRGYLNAATREFIPLAAS